MLTRIKLAGYALLLGWVLNTAVAFALRLGSSSDVKAPRLALLTGPVYFATYLFFALPLAACCRAAVQLRFRYLLLIASLGWAAIAVWAILRVSLKDLFGPWPSQAFALWFAECSLSRSRSASSCCAPLSDAISLSEAGTPRSRTCMLVAGAKGACTTMPSDPTAFIRRLPKAELHLHLEGTLSPETLVTLSQATPSPLSLEQARALYNYTDFTGFLMAFKAVTEHLRTAADYELVTYRMLERLHAQGVVHAEVYVSVGVIDYWARERPDAEPVETLIAGMERGRERGEQDFGITLYWIFDAVRHFGPEAAACVFRKAAEMRAAHPSIIGIGIGGDERRTGAEVFRDLYAEARAAGLRLTAHAGETLGPESIWAAINIGAERVGHALSAIEDPELMEVLAERQIPLEICVTSNLRTRACPSITEHPLRNYFDRGLMVTLNSDDPAMFGSDLENEYRIGARHFELTREHLRELAANSLEASFLPAERKLRLLRRLEAIV